MEKQHVRKSDTPEPPDGGYGWVIVIARFLQFGVMVQIIPSYQIIFGPKFDQCDASPTERSSVLVVFMTCMTLISVFVGPLGQASSERVVAFIGSSLQVLGLVICAFAISAEAEFLSFCCIASGSASILILSAIRTFIFCILLQKRMWISHRIQGQRLFSKEGERNNEIQKARGKMQLRYSEKESEEKLSVES